MKRTILKFGAILFMAGLVTVFVSCNSSVENLTDQLDDAIENY